MNHSTALHPALAGVASPAEPAARPEPAVPFRRISVRTAIWSLLLGMALVCPALLLLSGLPIEPMTSHRILNIARHFPLVILGSVIVGPLLEEMIFRGAIIQLGRRRLPVAIPAVFSVLLFASIHFPKGLGVVVLAAPLGALFTWMALRSRSLWPSLLCHVAFNMTAFVLTAAFGFVEKAVDLPPGISPSTLIPSLLPTGWLVFSFALAVVAVAMLRRDFSRRTAA